VTVCHLPPGTSKWNKIEHRLFSQITLNWRGRPLRSHQVIIDLIRNTTTTTGLTVHCVLDTEEPVKEAGWLAVIQRPDGAKSIATSSHGGTRRRDFPEVPYGAARLIGDG
jgi:hypothetical protein